MESLVKPSRPRGPAEIAQYGAVSFLTTAGLAGGVVAAASAMSGWQVGGGCGGLAALGALILAAAFGVVVAWFSAYRVGVVSCSGTGS